MEGLPDAAPSSAGSGPWLVVGLGNPGSRYSGNRHNVGAMVADRLAGELGGRFSAHRGQTDLIEGRLAPLGSVPGPRVLLAKPRSYMNVSGPPVVSLVRFFRVPCERLLVIHDELDLPFGELRLKRGGGEGGHNGLRSISQSLGSRDYCRLRIGIGRPPGRMDPADFVLRDFSGSEREEVPVVLVEAADVVTGVLRDGWERTQNVVNTRSR
jgi:PTH1 family peptidyl-tRNA hydrolase